MSMEAAPRMWTEAKPTSLATRRFALIAFLAITGLMYAGIVWKIVSYAP